MGCTQSTQDLTDSLALAINGHDSAQITKEQVSGIPYASQIVEFGGNPEALMVLAWAEPGRHQTPIALKWLSANSEMLVTQAGRITKTVNFPDNNLLSIHALKPDPLARGLHLRTTPHHWSYTMSWHPGYHVGYEAESRFEVLGEVTKQLPFDVQTLLHVKETISIPTIDFKTSNHYWLDPQTGRVIASEQTITPNGATFKLYTGKAYQQVNDHE
ncbi:YjbF family lipoprotein [uncultured Vibrio sp.]|uniref:YjbF family lipoprotein n=1 Tax=uncultured Vibrio sp. TaxID=114054 RepID=UPI0025E7C45E|nr:YjbF family lipoprotein [uncultured Vibrio sp.]